MQDEAYQYLYADGNTLHLLNLETFEEIEMPSEACDGGEESFAMLEGQITVYLFMQQN